MTLHAAFILKGHFIAVKIFFFVLNTDVAVYIHVQRYVCTLESSHFVTYIMKKLAAVSIKASNVIYTLKSHYILFCMAKISDAIRISCSQIFSQLKVRLVIILTFEFSQICVLAL